MNESNQAMLIFAPAALSGSACIMAKNGWRKVGLDHRSMISPWAFGRHCSAVFGKFSSQLFWQTDDDAGSLAC